LTEGKEAKREVLLPGAAQASITTRSELVWLERRAKGGKQLALSYPNQPTNMIKHNNHLNGA